MKSLGNCLVRMITPNSLTGIALLLVLIAAVPMAAALPPPTWTRPEVAKVAIPEPDSLALGDTVSFFIVVENPATAIPPDVDVDWYQVKATDVVSSVLEIDTDTSGVVLYQGDGAGFNGFRANVSDARAPRCTGVPAVCDHSDGVSQSHADKHGCRD